jgi:hypothetical protein
MHDTYTMIGGIDENDVIPTTDGSGGDRTRMPLGNISVNSNKVDYRRGGAGIGNEHIVSPHHPQSNSIDAANLPRSSGSGDDHSIQPLMTIEAAVPSSAMSTLTTPTLISPSAAGAVRPQSYAVDDVHNLNSIHDEDDDDDENIPPVRISTRAGGSSNVDNVMALVSPDGYSRRTTSSNARVSNNQNTSRRSPPTLQTALAPNPNMMPSSSSSSDEQSSIDNNVMGGREPRRQQHPQDFPTVENDYDDQSRTSSSSDSEMSMLSAALSIAGIDLVDDHRHRRHDHRLNTHQDHNPTRSSTTGGSTAVVSSCNLRHNDRDLNIHRADRNSNRNAGPTSQAAVNDLKIRLADTATQLTTVEDELRQRVEVEGSLRFAIDILRNRLNIRRIRGNKGRGERGGTGSGDVLAQDLEEKEDLDIVTEMLSELGLSGPPSQQAAQIARQMEDSELRTEGLRSRLARSEKERAVVEGELRERNQIISELRAELHTVKSKLTIAERRAEKDKAKLEKRCNSLESSKKVLKDELQRFKSQLELVAGFKPGDDYHDAVAAAAAAIASSGGGSKGGIVDQLCLRKPSAEEQETLEARAKAKVLLSVQKEADVTYQGAVKDLEAMISQVYRQELKAEIAAGSGGNAREVKERNGAQQQLEGSQQRLSELSTQRLDAVGEDFKLLLSTRDRMLKLHEKIKKQCDSILAASESVNKTETGR